MRRCGRLVASTTKLVVPVGRASGVPAGLSVRAVVPALVPSVVLVLTLLVGAVACAPDPDVGAARAPGTTGTIRPKPVVPTPVGEDPLPPALEERLQRVLDATRPTLTGTPGLIAGVWVPGTGAWASISVEADPTTSETLATNDHVRIGTVTTSMTVALILQLVDQGKLGLDDPISKWFPAIPDADRITVRNLATMRGGVGDTVRGGVIGQQRAADRSRAFTPEELTAGAAPAAPGAGTGTGTTWSDTNTILLGQIVEQVTGSPVRTVLQDRLFGPLGMHQTALPEATDASIPRPFTRGFTSVAGAGAGAGSGGGAGAGGPAGSGVASGAGTVEATGWNPSWLSSAGAATSTVGDLELWARHLGSGELLSPGTFEAQRDFTTDDPNRPPYGMGLMSFPQAVQPSLAWVGFEGTIDGYSTLIAYDPATTAVIVVIATSDVRVRDPGDGPDVSRDPTAVVTPARVAFEALREVLRKDPPPTTLPTLPPAPPLSTASPASSPAPG